MKKKIISFIMGTLMMVNIVGCDTPETDLSDADIIENTQVDYAQMYQETLGTIYSFVENIDSNAEYDDPYMGIFEAALASGDDALNEIGYVVKDINKDNIPELLVGSFNKQEGAYTNNDIYAIYTIINDNVEFVLSGRSRSMYSLRDDGKLFYMGSNGAAYSIFGTYYLSEDGLVVCDDYYFTYPDDNDYSKVEMYHNKTGEFEREVSEKLDIAQDDFWTIQEELAKGTEKIMATSFESFTY